LRDCVDKGDEPDLDDVKILWKRKVMTRHGCLRMRRMLTLPCFGEEPVGEMKDARMAEPDSRVTELQDLWAQLSEMVCLPWTLINKHTTMLLMQCFLSTKFSLG